MRHTSPWLPKFREMATPYVIRNIASVGSLTWMRIEIRPTGAETEFEGVCVENG